MMFLHYLVGPLVGSVIGYITNDIAIRMLFKPHEAKYVLGVHVPFTPGIIPKERNRITAALGQAISENLMNQDVLQRNLLSDEMMDKIEQGIEGFVASLRVCNEPVEQWLSHYVQPSDLAMARESVIDRVSEMVSEQLSLNDTLGDQLAHLAMEHVIERTRQSLMGKLGADRVLSLVTPLVERMLARYINQVLHDNTQTMTSQLVAAGVDNVMSRPVSSLLAQQENEIDHIKGSLLQIYRTVVTDQLPSAIKALDIRHMIESRINEMEMDEAEAIILTVLSRELRAIVWLGALLGCIMGTVTSLF